MADTHVVKRHSITVMISTAGSVLAISATMWWFAKPFITDAVANELESQVTKIVDDKVAPLNAGLRALLDGNIENLRRRIAAEQFRRAEAHRGGGTAWTLQDEQALNDLQDAMNTQIEARLGMIQSSRRRDR